MTTGPHVELSTFWKKRLIMLPNLVRLSSENSPRSTLPFLCCALALLGLPTFYGVAQSQEAEPSAEIKASADKNPDPAANATTEGGPMEKPSARDPDEPSMADLVARFNELVKAQRYGEAKMIARMAKEIDPHDPVVEIMSWKAQYRLGEIKSYSVGGNDGKASRTQVPAKIPVTPEMAKLWEQFNFALMEKRFDDAEQIGRKAMQLEPGNRAGELMISKAVFAEKPRPPSPEFLPQPKASPREIEIITKLDQPISFDFEQQSLSAALRQLEKQLGFNILLDVPSLKKHNLQANQFVTLKVRDISLKNALKLILDTCELTYLVEHECVTILPKLEADLRLETRIYPVRDLIVENDDFDILIEAIRAGVAPDSWFKMDRASISKVPASGSLVIYQSPRVHVDVLRLLRTLREAKGVPAAEGGAAQDIPTAVFGISGHGGGGGGFF